MRDPIEEAYNQGYRAGQDDFEAYCDQDHCDDYSCHCAYPENSDVEDLVKDYLRQIRMGYTLDVTLQDVLEEMERTIRD